MIRLFRSLLVGCIAGVLYMFIAPLVYKHPNPHWVSFLCFTCGWLVVDLIKFLIRRRKENGQLSIL